MSTTAIIEARDPRTGRPVPLHHRATLPARTWILTAAGWLQLSAAAVVEDTQLTDCTGRVAIRRVEWHIPTDSLTGAVTPAEHEALADAAPTPAPTKPTPAPTPAEQFAADIAARVASGELYRQSSADSGGHHRVTDASGAHVANAYPRTATRHDEDGGGTYLAAWHYGPALTGDQKWGGRIYADAAERIARGAQTAAEARAYVAHCGSAPAAAVALALELLDGSAPASLVSALKLDGTI